MCEPLQLREEPGIVDGRPLPTKRLIALAEPCIILAMGLVVGFIVVAMLMAILSVTDLPI